MPLNNNNTRSNPLHKQTSLNIWVMTSGAAGMRSQVLGLANAISRISPAIITEKIINLTPWASLLPGHLNPAPLKGLSKNSSPLLPPWPDILISSGRRSSGPSIAIGKQNNGKTYRVHIQNPQTPTGYFNLVASMVHDNLKGKNVVDTKTALHRLDHTLLQQEKNKWNTIWFNTDNLLNNNSAPILGILLGGKNKKYGFDQERVKSLLELIHITRAQTNATILITPSSRTELFVTEALEKAFHNDPKIWIWNKTGENPYQGILTNADHLLVTADSVSMISESLYTKAPVHIFPLNGTSRRHKLFLGHLQSEKLIHPIDKRIDFTVNATQQPIDETARIAHIIMQNYEIHTRNRI